MQLIICTARVCEFLFLLLLLVLFLIRANRIDIVSYRVASKRCLLWLIDRFFETVLLTILWLPFCLRKKQQRTKKELNKIKPVLTGTCYGMFAFVQLIWQITIEAAFFIYFIEKNVIRMISNECSLIHADIIFAYIK